MEATESTPDQQPTAASNTQPGQTAPEQPTGGDVTTPPGQVQAQPETGQAEFQSGEAAPVPTEKERADANYQLASQSSLLGALGGSAGAITRAAQGQLARWKDQSAGTPDLTPEQANTKYPGMPVPFNEPISPALAELQWNYQKNKTQLQEWAARGTDEHPWDKTVNSFLAMASDPSTYIAGQQIGGFFKGLGMAKGFGQVLAESATFNAVAAGTNYIQAANEHQKAELPSASQFAVDTAGMVGLHYGGEYLGRLMFGAKSMAEATLQETKTPQDIQESNARMALAQHEAGAEIDMSGGEAERAQRAEGTVEGVRPQQFDVVEHPSEAPYYAARSAEGMDSHYTGLGGANSLEVIRNPVEANNRVSNPGGEPGHLAEVTPRPEQKFLDLDQPVSQLDSDPELKQIVENLEAKTGGELETHPDDTIQDVLERLQKQGLHGVSAPDILDQVKAEVQAAGYDGYRYGSDDGAGSAKKEGLILFDKNITPGKEFVANPDITPQTSADQKIADLERTTTPENAQGSTQELQEQIHEAHQSKPLNSTPDYMDPIVQQMTDGFRAQLEKMAATDPALAKELEALDRLDLNEKQTEQGMRDFADCLAEGIV